MVARLMRRRENVACCEMTAKRDDDAASAVLVAMVVGEDERCHMNFMTSMITLHNVLDMVRIRGVSSWERALFDTTNDALNAFRQNPNFGTLVLLDSSTAWSPDWIVRALVMGEPFVVACYPLQKTFDWERVRSTNVSDPRHEPLVSRGLTYSVRLRPGGRMTRQGYVSADRAALGLAVIRREVVDVWAAASPTHSTGTVFVFDGVDPNGSLEDGVSRLCRLWLDSSPHAAILADVQSAAMTFGKFAFQGSLLERLISKAHVVRRDANASETIVKKNVDVGTDE